uniref:ATP-dependent (S)-NAD(P)H-hydrate dehydratase n=1 Tax=Ditylenchus dipsaci TaxID=166011 RepID=A0A915CWG5_9BILA
MDEFSSSQVRPLGSQHVPSLPPLHSSSQSSDVALQPSNVDSFGYQWSQHVPPPPLPPSTRSYGSQYVPQPLPTPSQFSGVVLQPLIVGSGPQHVPPPPPLPTYSQSSDVALQPSNVGSVGDQGHSTFRRLRIFRLQLFLLLLRILAWQISNGTSIVIQTKITKKRNYLRLYGSASQGGGIIEENYSGHFQVIYAEYSFFTTYCFGWSRTGKSLSQLLLPKLDPVSVPYDPYNSCSILLDLQRPYYNSLFPENYNPTNVEEFNATNSDLKLLRKLQVFKMLVYFPTEDVKNKDWFAQSVEDHRACLVTTVSQWHTEMRSNLEIGQISSESNYSRIDFRAYEKSHERLLQPFFSHGGSLVFFSSCNSGGTPLSDIIVDNCVSSVEDFEEYNKLQLSFIEQAKMLKVLYDHIPNDSSLRKGDLGRVGVIGGCLSQYTGAPYFAAFTSLRIVPDLAHVFCHPAVATVVNCYSPALMVHPTLLFEEMEPTLSSMDSAIVPLLRKLIDLIRNSPEIALVIDADGLYHLPECLNQLKGCHNVVITPNYREFDRLYSKVVSNSSNGGSKVVRAKQLAHQLEVVVLAKDQVDIISDMGIVYHSEEMGSPRRCAGQGDILSGAVAVFSMWSKRKHSKTDYCRANIVEGSLAASDFIRFVAGRAFEKMGRSTTADDIISQIPHILKKMDSI